MKPYKTKDNETLLFRYTVKKEDKVVNIITMYQDESGKLCLHNANGIKQELCPNMRFGGGYYCKSYADKCINIDVELWNPIITTTENVFLFSSVKNPKYKNCLELGMDAGDFKKCKYYKESEVNQ